MATRNVQEHCSLCSEENNYLCKRCLQTFCFDHLKLHRDLINQEFNQIEDNYHLLIENLNEQINNPNQRLFMKKIHQWKEKSIEQIEQVAKECEENLIKYTNKRFVGLKNDLDEKFKNKSNEKQLHQIKKQLNLLNQQFEEISNISFETKSTSFIDRIYLKPSKVSFISFILSCVLLRTINRARSINRLQMERKCYRSNQRSWARKPSLLSTRCVCR